MGETTAMSTPSEMAEILMAGVTNGHGTILVMPNAKPFLTCRGEILSVTGGKWGDDFEGYNVRFTAKQCKKMLEHLMSEMMNTKVTVTPMTRDEAERRYGAGSKLTTETRSSVKRCEQCNYPIAPCTCLLDGCVGAFHTELPADVEPHDAVMKTVPPISHDNGGNHA